MKPISLYNTINKQTLYLIKKSIYTLPLVALLFNGCLKSNLNDDMPIGVDPSDYNIELEFAEFRTEGGQWTQIIDGDTLRFNWALFHPQSMEPISSRFGPGGFNNRSNNSLLDIGKTGIFYSENNKIFFAIYNNATENNSLLDSGEYRLEGDYFYLKKIDSEIKFRIVGGHYIQKSNP